MKAALILLWLVPCADAEFPAQLVVEAEEAVYTYESPDNGSGPLWCHGSTCLVRLGERTFATGVEKIPNLKPLNNCLWNLYERTEDGWKCRYTDTKHRTREPSPMAVFHDGRMFVSANPTLAPLNVYSGPARPEIASFSAADPASGPEILLPKWSGQPPFTEHSYRSFAADGKRGELILFQNIGYTHAEWAFLDGGGTWAAAGRLDWPWGADYEEPQPIRTCYPAVALKNRAVYFFGVSDIVEPNSAWRAYKKELTGRDWDYDFRRLFYTSCPDITTGKFVPWIEVAGREETGGGVMPGDLYVADDGRVFLLWRERAIDERLREKFFPQAKQSHSIRLAVVRDGAVCVRRTLCESVEGESSLAFGTPRFHVTDDGRLFALFYLGGSDESGTTVNENRLLALDADGAVVGATKIAFRIPLSDFFTATPRAGSLPSRTLEMLGAPVGNGTRIDYRRVRLGPAQAD